MPAILAASKSDLQALILILCKELGRTIDAQHRQPVANDAPAEHALDYFQDQAGIQFLGLAAYIIADRGLESATELLGDVFKAQQWQWSNGKSVEVPMLSYHIRQLLRYINEDLIPRVGPSGKGHIQTNKGGEGICFELCIGKVKITGKGKLPDFIVEEHEA